MINNGGILKMPYPTETDWNKRTRFMKKIGFEPITAIITNGKIIHVDYIPKKLLDEFKGN